MKIFCYGVAVLATAVLTGVAQARDYDVCVNPAPGGDVALDDIGAPGFSPGDGITAVGIIVPGGTIPNGGVASCDDIADERIGTFFVKGRIVAGLPNAADNHDLAYVDWQFRIEDGNKTGAFDTSGPVPDAAALPVLATYPHTLVGASNGIAPATGEVEVTILGAGGFQFRVSVPGNSGKGN
jgi:hypothetical protein